MSIRDTPYVARPSQEWKNIADSLSSNTLFLVARIGPTVFGIKDENDETFRITLGNPHKCSCGAQSSTCVHKLFCLIKVLKVPVEHSLCFQTSLTDNEMDQVLDGIETNTNRRHIRARPKPAVVLGANMDSMVPRQPLLDDQEETCPICQDEMTNEQALSWCRHGCGNNVHAKCMMKFCQYKISNKQDATCPFCRSPWNMDVLRLDCKGKSSLKHSYSPVHCCSCKCLQRGNFYRCVECSQLACKSTTGKPMDFCADCFNRMGNVHNSHHFVTSDITSETTHGLEWVPVKNPATKGIITDPGLLRELQGRELGVQDYDLLLQLDDGGPAPQMSELCVESLPPFKRSSKSSSKQNSRCWCSSTPSPQRPSPHGEIVVTSSLTGAATINSPTGNSSVGITSSMGSTAFNSDNNMHGHYSPHRGGEKLPLRILPCRHVAHDSCLREDLETLLAEDPARIMDYRCSHIDCGARIFIGLSRRRRRKPKDSTSKNTNVATVAGDSSGKPQRNRFRGAASSVDSMNDDSDSENLMPEHGLIGLGIQGVSRHSSGGGGHNGNKSSTYGGGGGVGIRHTNYRSTTRIHHGNKGVGAHNVGLDHYDSSMGEMLMAEAGGVVGSQLSVQHSNQQYLLHQQQGQRQHHYNEHVEQGGEEYYSAGYNRSINHALSDPSFASMSAGSINSAASDTGRDPMVYKQPHAPTLPRLSMREQSHSISNLLPDNVAMAVGGSMRGAFLDTTAAAGNGNGVVGGGPYMLTAKGGNGGGGVAGAGRVGQRPPIGRRVRLKALGATPVDAADGMGMVADVLGSIRSRVAATAVLDGAGGGGGGGGDGYNGRRGQQGGTRNRSQQPTIDSTNAAAAAMNSMLTVGGTSTGRPGLSAAAAASIGMPLGSLSERSPTLLAPLPNDLNDTTNTVNGADTGGAADSNSSRRTNMLDGRRRSFSGSGDSAGSTNSRRSSAAKENVQRVLEFNLNTKSRRENRAREDAAAAAAKKDFTVQSVACPFAAPPPLSLDPSRPTIETGIAALTAGDGLGIGNPAILEAELQQGKFRGRKGGGKGGPSRKKSGNVMKGSASIRTVDVTDARAQALAFDSAITIPIVETTANDSICDMNDESYH